MSRLRGRIAPTTTPPEHFLLREIEKRDRIIQSLSKAKLIRVGVAKPLPAQGRPNLD